jgi:hypothetical protein
MTDWTGESYLNELAGQPAARAPATLGEIWRTHWAAGALDTIEGAGAPFVDTYNELVDAMRGATGQELPDYARAHGVDLSTARNRDEAAAMIGTLIETLPEEQKKAIAPLKDVRRRAEERARATEEAASDAEAGTYGLTGHATAFIAGTARQMVSPSNIAVMLGTAPIAGPGGSVAKFILGETAAGAAGQAIVEPAIEARRGELGIDAGVGRAVTNIAEAGIGAGALAGLFRGAAASWRLIRRAKNADLPAEHGPADYERSFSGYAAGDAADHTLADVQAVRSAAAGFHVPEELRVASEPDVIAPRNDVSAMRARDEPQPFDRGDIQRDSGTLADIDNPSPVAGFDLLNAHDLEAAARFAEREHIVDSAIGELGDKNATLEAKLAHAQQVEQAAKALEEGKALEGGAPTPAAAAAAPVAKRAFPKRDPNSFSLFEFLASKGGLHPEDKVGRDSAGRPVTYAPGQDIPGGGMEGEIFGIFDRTNPFVPGQGPLLRKTGYSLARAQELAAEAGYLPVGSDFRDFHALLDEEARGRKQYRQTFTPKEKRDTAIEKLELEAHRAGLAQDFDARMGELQITDPAPGLRKRALQIMEKEGEKDPLLAYERALMEDEARFEEKRRVRQTEKIDIPGWDVADVADEPGGASPGGGRAAARSAEPPANAGVGEGAPGDRGGAGSAGSEGGKVGDQALAQDAERALSDAGGDVEITLIDEAGNVRKVSAREAMLEAKEEAQAAAEFKDCIGDGGDDDIPF